MGGTKEPALPSKREENQEEQSEAGSQRKVSRESSEPTQSDEDEQSDQNPRSELEKFDWDDLEQRFQSMVQARDLEEQKLWEEFTQLVEVSLVWSFSQKNMTDRINQVLQDLGCYTSISRGGQVNEAVSLDDDLF